jgi:flagellar basal body-associated protein FliL
MTPEQRNPDDVDPTQQSGRPIMVSIALLVLFTALVVMVIVFVTTT